MKPFYLLTISFFTISCNYVIDEIQAHNKKTITYEDYYYLTDKKNRYVFLDAEENVSLSGYFSVIHDSIIMEEFFLEDGYLEGEKTKYNFEGKPVSKENYTAGVLHGPKIEYYLSGEISSETTYKNGRRSTDKYGYNVKGDTIYKLTTKAGRDYESFYNNGKIIMSQFEKIMDGSKHIIMIKYDGFQNPEIIFAKEKDTRSKEYLILDDQFNVIDRVDPQIDFQKATYYSSIITQDSADW